MNHTLSLALCLFAVGCGDLAHTEDAAAPDKSCDDGEVCRVPGDTAPRRCFLNMCGIACDVASECPYSPCRSAGCMGGICIYSDIFDGVECSVDGVFGVCDDGDCMTAK